MELTLTHLDPTVGAHTIVPNLDPSSGTVTFTAPPSDSAQAQHFMRCLLRGYGVSPDLVQGGSNEDSERHVRARMRAHGTRTLVVRHAENLLIDNGEPHLRTLHDMCSTEGVDLMLTCDETVGEALADFVNDNGGHVPRDTDHLVNIIAAAARTTETPTPGVDDFPALVPAADFYMFRHRCRQLLTLADFEQVDNLYVSVAREVRDHPFTDPKQASEWLLKRTATSDNPAYVKTVLRGAQAAMFTHGVLLKANVDFFCDLAARGAHRRLTRPEVRALRGYRETWRAPVILALDAGLTPSEVQALTVGDLGNSDAKWRHDMAPEASTLIAAHHAYKTFGGATPAESAFGAYGRDVGRVRRQALFLGIPLGHTRQMHSHESMRDRWQSALGVTLISLVDEAVTPRGPGLGVAA